MPHDRDWLCISREESSKVNEFRAQHFSGTFDRTSFAVAPGSKRPSRMWSENRFSEVIAKLVDEIDLFPIFFGSVQEQGLCERILARVGRGINIAGKLNIRESAGLLKSCRFYLGNDTGTMHLAAAVGIPCVAIFSAADRNGQWEPFGEGHQILRRNVECEGCRVDICPRANLCLELIDSNEVYNACVDLILRDNP
ncbi:MAG: glycosyltransferase family 9 protein [Pyrinomonadaceae bacterium]